MESCTCPASAWKSGRPGRRPGGGRRPLVAEPRAADGGASSDLGSYQYAVRLVLTNDLITATHPRAGALASVLRWADLIARDFAELLGYTLVATAHRVRLPRRLDTLDATQRSAFTARSGRQSDRRRLSYLCLVLAIFQRSRIEISLADLVRAFAPTANAIDGLGFDATITEHKRAVVDVLDWLPRRRRPAQRRRPQHEAVRSARGGRAPGPPPAAGTSCPLLRNARRRDSRGAARNRTGRQPGPAHRPRGGAARRGRDAGRPHRPVHRSAVPGPGRSRQQNRRAAAGQGRGPAGGSCLWPGPDPDPGPPSRR